MDSRIGSTAAHGTDEQILVTGAGGFIGSRVVAQLREKGFTKIRCLARSPRGLRTVAADNRGDCPVEWQVGNLLSRELCDRATRDVSVILHLAAGTGTKSFADAYLNSVVTTRNLLDSAVAHGGVRRFVNLSSFAVYSTAERIRGRVLDESWPIETDPASRHDAYCYAKTKQDELVMDYGRRCGIPYILVRPGVVYGPGKTRIHGRVGIDPFGVFLHLGGSNRIPFTYVDNCATAIVLAGVQPGIDGSVVNIVDDDLPTSRAFLRSYKTKVRRFPSIYLPHFVSYASCWLWENYSRSSSGQLPPVYNRRQWRGSWRRMEYSNNVAKRVLGWKCDISTDEGLDRYFAAARQELKRA